MAVSKRYGTWKVDLPDESYTWEPDDMLFSECNLVLTELAGRTFDEWIQGIDDRDPTACQVLVWFLRLKAGKPEDRMGLDFPLRQLDLVQVPKDKTNSEPTESSTSDTSSEPGSDQPTLTT